MFGLKSIINRATKAVRDIGSFATSNPLATAALGTPFLFSKGFPSLGASLFSGGTTTGGIPDLARLLLGGGSALLGYQQFQRDKDMQMKIYNDMMNRLLATDRKFGSEFGGSPFKNEQFGNLIADIRTGETFDKFDEKGNPIRTKADESGKAVPVTSKTGGIASLMAGGPPEQDMGQFGSSDSPMGASVKNPFDSMNSVSGMIPETPLRQVMPPTMNMGGQATGVPGLTPDMSGAEMMDTIEDNPGITAFFPRKLGMIDGPGGPKDDKIPAMLSDGEFVFTAKAVENAGGPRAMYNMMNKLDPESSKGRGII
jgi:hypothetical protein